MSTTTAQTRTRPADRYRSLADLRDQHSELLKHCQEGQNTAEVLANLDRIREFIERGRATGLVLNQHQDRWAAQSLLDYWVTVLIRAGQEPPDSTLARFDPELASPYQPLADDQYPYPGLMALTRDQSPLFFGRERLVKASLRQLQNNALLALIGPIGSGRTSLVEAGIFAALQANRLEGSKDWHIYPTVRPGSDPFLSLLRALQPKDGTPEWMEDERRRLRKDPGHL